MLLKTMYAALIVSGYWTEHQTIQHMYRMFTLPLDPQGKSVSCVYALRCLLPRRHAALRVARLTITRCSIRFPVSYWWREVAQSSTMTV